MIADISLISRRLDASTMLRTMKRLIALSFGIAFPVETQLRIDKTEGIEIETKNFE